MKLPRKFLDLEGTATPVADVIREIASMSPLSNENRQLLNSCADQYDILNAHITMLSRIVSKGQIEDEEGGTLASRLRSLEMRIAQLEKQAVNQVQVEDIVMSLMRQYIHR